MFGVGRSGRRLARRLAESGVPLLAVDSDPEVVRAVRIPVRTLLFGDIEDSEFLDTQPLHRLRWIVSTLSQPELNIGLARALRARGCGAVFAATAHTERDAAQLRLCGIERILTPYWDAADLAAARLGEELRAAAGHGTPRAIDQDKELSP